MSKPLASQLGEAMTRQFSYLLPSTLSMGSVGRPVNSIHQVSQSPLFLSLVHHLCQMDPKAKLFIFGSTRAYGFYDSGVGFAASVSQGDGPVVPPSDVDMAILREEDLVEGSATDSSGELTRNVQADFLEKLLSRMVHDGGKGVQKEEGSSSRESSPPSPHSPLQYGSVSTLVKRTRVPVLRVKNISTNRSTTEGVECIPFDFDITCGRRCGIRNSELMFLYTRQIPLVRYLMLSLKKWSKQTGLNTAVKVTTPAESPSNVSGGGERRSVVGTGSLTSYGFNLLVVYYLLRRGLVEYIPLTVPPPLATASDDSPLSPSSFVPNPLVDVNHISPVPPFLPLEAPSPSSVQYLGEMTLDFLHFYAHEFDYETEVATLSRFDALYHFNPHFNRPGVSSSFPIVTQSALGWTRAAEETFRMKGEKSYYRLCIEDPFEVDLNVGRHVTAVKLMLWKRHWEKALRTGLLLFPE